MKPSQVTFKNQSKVWRNLYGKRFKKTLDQPKPRIKVGSWVRVSFLKGLFHREYSMHWSGEVYQVVSSSVKQGRVVYALQDYEGELVTGLFYPEELQVSKLPTVYRVEKVLKTRKRRGHPRESLIRWKNWGPRWDSWVTEEDLQNLREPPA